MRVTLVAIMWLIYVSIFAYSIPLTFCEQVQEADYILKGRIESKETVYTGKARFVSTRYKLVVERDLLGNFPQKEYSFVMGGGDEGEKKFRVSDVPMLEVGEVSIFLLYRAEKKYFSLVVGGEQGRYTRHKDPKSGMEVVLDASRKPMLDDKGNQISFARFEAQLERDIPDYRNRPRTFFPPDPNGNPNNLRPEDMKTWDASDKRGKVSMAVDPVDINNSDMGPQILHRSYTDLNGNRVSYQNTADERYVYNEYGYIWDDPPTVFNQLSSTYPTLGLHDQIQMAHWNKYIKLYKVRSAPTGTFGYPDFENDICGLVDNATMIDVFDQGWGPTTLAICWSWGINYMWEADIAFNSAKLWSNDPYTVFTGAANSVENTFLHELGHAWGAGHPFNELSVMNYYQNEFRAYTVLYYNDVDAVRYKYANDISIRNLAVYGHYSNGAYQQLEPAISDTLVTPGSAFNIHNVTVENPGTYEMPMNVDVFLTPTALRWNGAVYLTTLNMGTMNAETSNLLANIQVNVPLTTPPGYYHVALRVATGGDQISYDNATWINNQIHVTDPPVPGLWVGGHSPNWHYAANWSGNFIPDSTTDVLIPAGCLNNPQIVQSDGFCRNITIESGAVLSIDYNTTFYGDVINSGFIFVGNPANGPTVYIHGSFVNLETGQMSYSYSQGIVRVYGSWTEHPGSAVAMQALGTLQFIGGGTSNIVMQSTNSQHQNFEVQKDAGGSVVFSSACTVPIHIDGQFWVNPNNSVYYQSDQDLFLSGNLAVSATSVFEALSGTINMVGMGSGIELSNNSIINNLDIRSQGVTTLYSDIRLNGSLYINIGSLNARYHTIYIKGSWFNGLSPYGFDEQTSNVVFNGDEDQNLYSESFYTMTVNKPGGRIMMRPGATVNATNYNLIAGEILVQGATFNVADIANNNGIYGTYRVESGTINLHQDSSSSIDINGNWTIYDGMVRIYGGASSCWFAGSANASLNMYGGTLDVVDQGIYINNTGYQFTENITGGTIRTSRSFMVNRTDFNPTNNIVELYGSGDAYVNTAESSSLHHLIINKSGRTGEPTRSNTIIGTERLAVMGNLMISAGILSAPPIIYIGGNWYNMVGPDAFIESTGAVVFQGSDHQYCTTENFNIIRLAKAGGALRIQTAIVSCNSYEWYAGAVDVIIGSFTALDLAQDGIYGDFYVNLFSYLILYQDAASWVDLNGTINMLGGECHVYGGSVTSWWGYALPATINMNSGLIYFHDQGIEIPNTATLNITGGTIKTDGSFALNKEDFQGTNWTLELSGGNDAGLWVAASSWLCNLIINKAASRTESVIMRDREGNEQNTRSNSVYANTNLMLSGSMAILAGYFHAPVLMNLQGNWTSTANPGGFINESGTVVFTGFQQSTIFSSTGFNNCNINKAADGIAVQIASNASLSATNLIIMDGLVATSSNSGVSVTSIVISDGAGINLSGDNVDCLIMGNFANYNTVNNQSQGLYAGTSTLRFMGDADQYFTNQSPVELFSLWIACLSGASFRPNTQLTIHNLTIDSGGFSSTANISHTITGDFLFNGGQWFDHASTLYLTGSEDQSLSLLTVFSSPDNAWFNNIVINKPIGTVSINNCPLHLRNQGNLNIVSGVLDLNDQELFSTGVVTVGSGATLRADAGAEIHIGSGLEVIDGGRIEIAGSSETPVLVTHNQTGYPSFAIGSGGTISAEHCIFEYISGSGVNLLPGALVDASHAFNYCTFRNGAENGSLLTLNDANGYTITGASFPANTWNSAYNVSKTVAEGEVFFANVTGGFAGPAFENDANNRIQWNDYKADLIVLNAAWSNTQPEIGDYVSLTAWVKNTGNVACGVFYLDMARNLTQAPEYGYTNEYSVLVNGIPAGDSLQVTFENITWGVAETWQSWLLADASQVVPEFTENDNTGGPYQITWQQPALPNLSISVGSWSNTNPILGEEIEITVSVTNNTAVDISDPVDVDLYLHPDGQPDGSIAGDLAYTFMSLSAGQTVTHTFSGITHYGVDNWQSYLLADRTNSILETDEMDNAVAAQIIYWQDIPAVSNLVVSFNPATQLVELNWDYNLTPDRFNIYRTTDPLYGVWELVGSTALHEFSIAPVADRHFYLVKAEND